MRCNVVAGFRAWGALTLLLALAVGCTDDGPTENGNPDHPSFASTGTSGSLSVNLDQFANGTGSKDPQWQNGDLNGNNSAYPPDGSVPFRLSVDGLKPGTNSIHINYDWTAGGHHAYDFLATVDAFVKSANGLNVCEPNGGSGAVPSPWCQKVGNVYSLKAAANGSSDIESFGNSGDNFLNDGGTSAGAFGASTQLTASEVTGTLGLTSDVGSLILVGGTITSISNPASGHTGNFDGNSTGDVVVTFNIPSSICSAKPCAVLLLWSGHLADDQGSNAYWNQANGGSADGVSQISGAPWHMRTLNITTDIGTPQEKVNGNKNQDRSIQPSAIVVEPPQLTLTKTADATTVNAGSNIGFTVTVSNTGAGTATGVTISDALPGGSGVDWSESPDKSECSITGSPPTETLNCTVGDLAPGGSFSVHVQSGTTAASCAVYNNQASASATNHATVQASASTTVSCPTLSIAKEPDSGDNGSTVTAGSQISFSITVSNTGAGTANGVTLTDTLPAGTGISWSTATSGCSITDITVNSVTRQELDCTIGTLAGTSPGPAGSFTATVTSSTTRASCAVLNNKAFAVGTNTGDPVNDTGQITVECPTLSIAKEPDSGDNGSTVTAGSQISFSITVSNTGAGDASSVTLTDTLPAGTGISWSTATSGCSITNITVNSVTRQELDCTIGTLAGTDPGPAGSFTATVTSNTTATSCAVLNNKAFAVGSNTGDPVNDTGQITISGCTKGQILPTASTCSSFTGNDASLLNLFATVVQGHVNTVSPGVWFYFLSVIAPSASFTVNIRESNDGGLANFQINNGQVNAYTAACATFNGDVVTLVTPGNPTGADVAFSGATAGAKYIIGVKYQAGTTLDGVLGSQIPNAGVVYSYTTQINGGSVITDNTATVTLLKK